MLVSLAMGLEHVGSHLWVPGSDVSSKTQWIKPLGDLGTSRLASFRVFLWHKCTSCLGLKIAIYLDDLYLKNDCHSLEGKLQLYHSLPTLSQWQSGSQWGLWYFPCLHQLQILGLKMNISSGLNLETGAGFEKWGSYKLHSEHKLKV